MNFIRLTKKQFEKRILSPDFIKKCFFVTNKTNKVWGLICRMELCDVSSLTLLPDLEYLDLNYNQLTHVSALESLTKLTYLSLIGNYLRALNGLESLTKLRYLDLCDNQLKDVSVLVSHTNLRYINLSYNQLTDVSVKGLWRNHNKIIFRDSKSVYYLKF